MMACPPRKQVHCRIRQRFSGNDTRVIKTRPDREALTVMPRWYAAHVPSAATGCCSDSRCGTGEARRAVEPALFSSISGMDLAGDQRVSARRDPEELLQVLAGDQTAPAGPAVDLGWRGQDVKLAGRADTLFSDDATALIHTTARGYPRAVNNLALQSLVATYAAGKAIVDEQAARAAVTEVTDT
jgi:hypothetical protein